MTKYILLGFPEIQDYMDHPRFNDECFYAYAYDPCDTNSYYFVPEDLYNEINQIK